MRRGNEGQPEHTASVAPASAARLRGCAVPDVILTAQAPAHADSLTWNQAGEQRDAAAQRQLPDKASSPTGTTVSFVAYAKGLISPFRHEQCSFSSLVAAGTTQSSSSAAAANVRPRRPKPPHELASPVSSMSWKASREKSLPTDNAAQAAAGATTAYRGFRTDGCGRIEQ